MKKGGSLKHPGIVMQKDSFLEMVKKEMEGSEQGEVIIDDFSFYQKLDKLAKSVRPQWIVTYDSGPKNIFFERNIDVQLEKAIKKVVWLENGGYLVIEETEACTVIDVNTGKFVGKGKKAETLFQTNLLAAKEVAHQLQLRNIGGIVLVDFINMDQRQHQKEVIEIMKQETAMDEMRVQVLGFTELGILELTRKRAMPSLSEKMMVSCPVCGGVGKVASPETVAFQLERELMEYRKTDEEAVWVEASQAVTDVLLGKKESYRAILEEIIAKKLVLSITNDPINKYEVKRFGSYQEMHEASRFGV